jgi:hypothetical protein
LEAAHQLVECGVALFGRRIGGPPYQGFQLFHINHE